MKEQTNIEIIEGVNKSLTGTLDFRDLARKVTKSFMKQLSLQGGAIFRVN